MRTVLVVEADQQERRRLVQALESSGLRTIAVSKPSDLATVDVPTSLSCAVLCHADLEGEHEVQKWIRSADLPKSVCLFVVVDNPEVGFRQALTSNGVSECFSWPVSAELLIARLNTLEAKSKDAAANSIVPRGYARRILVVDDSLTYANALMDELRKDGHDVAFAETGGAALTFLNRVDVDLVVVDVFLPDMNGVEVCKSIKSQPSTAHLPVLVLTGREQSAVRDAAAAAEADDFAVKARDFTTISAKVRSMLVRGQFSPRGRRNEADAPGSDRSARTPKSDRNARGASNERIARFGSNFSAGASLRGEALFEAIVTGTGLSKVLARSTVETTCRRLQLEPKSLSSEDVAKVVAELERTLKLFLPPDQAQERLSTLASLGSGGLN